jgi:hypothetical protein
MTIPQFDLGLVLPPFLGSRPGSMASQSPYTAMPLELVHRFGTSPERNRLLRGLFDLRVALRNIGVQDGFQWIDGSFVEDKERRLGTAPGDIDIVTCFDRPPTAQADPDWDLIARPLATTLFHPRHCKATYHCEAFYIDLGRSNQSVASLSAFWFSLFSHQRDTFRWKGVVRVNLGPTEVDSDADAELTRRGY